ncbi:MAG: hypothetical protein AB7G93_23535 [Bdellovibrionales bacterium]
MLNIEALLKETQAIMESDTLVKPRFTMTLEMQNEPHEIWKLIMAYQNHGEPYMRIFGLILNWLATNKNTVMLLSKAILDLYLKSGELPRTTCDSRCWKQLERVFEAKTPYLKWLTKGHTSEKGEHVAGSVELVHPEIRRLLVDYIGGEEAAQEAKEYFVKIRDGIKSNISGNGCTPVVVEVGVDVGVDVEAPAPPPPPSLSLQESPKMDGRTVEVYGATSLVVTGGTSIEIREIADDLALDPAFEAELEQFETEIAVLKAELTPEELYFGSNEYFSETENQPGHLLVRASDHAVRILLEKAESALWSDKQVMYLPALLDALNALTKKYVYCTLHYPVIEEQRFVRALEASLKTRFKVVDKQKEYMQFDGRYCQKLRAKAVEVFQRWQQNIKATAKRVEAKAAKNLTAYEASEKVGQTGA